MSKDDKPSSSTASVPVRRTIPCPHCNGGQVSVGTDTVKCATCDGTGKVTVGDKQDS